MKSAGFAVGFGSRVFSALRPVLLLVLLLLTLAATLLLLLLPWDVARLNTVADLLDSVEYTVIRLHNRWTLPTAASVSTRTQPADPAYGSLGC